MFVSTGKFDFSNLINLHTQVHSEYGKIAKISGLEPNNDLIFIYDPKDVEAVYRNDGPWPIRPPLKCLEYYRKYTKKDFFEGVGGVLIE
jgi:hypothetical protein